jgi:hypothetical protein
MNGIYHDFSPPSLPAVMCVSSPSLRRTACPSGYSGFGVRKQSPEENEKHLVNINFTRSHLKV